MQFGLPSAAHSVSRQIIDCRQIEVACKMAHIGAQDCRPICDLAVRLGVIIIYIRHRSVASRAVAH